MRSEVSNMQGGPGRKLLFGLLTLAACAIWGSVYFRATGGWREPEAPSQAADSVRIRKAPPREAALRYQGVVRDVFRPPAAGPADPVSEAPDERPKRDIPPRLPPLRHALVGVVDGTALLRDPRGQVTLASEGDTLWRRRVQAIQPGRVIFSTDGEPADTLHLQDQSSQRDWFN